MCLLEEIQSVHLTDALQYRPKLISDKFSDHERHGSLHGQRSGELSALQR